VTAVERQDQVTPPTGERPTAEAESRAVHRATGVAAMNLLYVSGAVVALVLAWQLVIWIFGVPSYLLPPPLEVFETIGEEASQLARHALVTAWVSILAFLLAMAVGAALGVVIAFSPRISRVLYPLLVGSNAIPKVALAPLFVVWLGFGVSSKVVIGFTIAFFPVVINTVAGLRSVPDQMIELARSTGGGALRTFVKIRVPYALPSFFAGLKVAISLAVIGAVVGEFVGSDEGLGYVLIVTGSQLNSHLLYAALIVLTVIAVLLYLLVEIAEMLVVPGRRRGKSR
jgi:NitT/TauT family transport system permease protein